MNLPVFPVGTTNIFPMANSTRGGQLMTEYNIKSHLSVASDSNVRYTIGLSFCHSEDDYKVTPQTDGAGVVISSSALEIAPGRAVVDGHYVESLIPIVIDIAKINAELVLNKMDPLMGELSVGLRIMYSTEQTMAGAMLTEGKGDFYEGIHVVILPRDQFLLPRDVPTQPDKVTAHLKLADVLYRNGTVSAKTIFNNYPGKCQVFSAERIGNADLMLSDTYLKKTGLNPGDLYAFAGKGTDGVLDTWCKATDSLIVWDKNPQRSMTRPLYEESAFITDLDRRVKLILAHKQVDGYKNLAGNLTYLQNKALALPMADYSRGTSGTVDSRYTDHIKSIETQLQNIYRMPNGEQVGYIESLEAPREQNLPPLNDAWKPGDYILVRLDTTLDVSLDGVGAPSTMYVVLAGGVKSVQFHSIADTRNGHNLPGLELGYDVWDDANGLPNTTDPDEYNAYWSWDYRYRGVVGKDYFTLQYKAADGNTKYAFYTVASTDRKEYSSPVFVTGAMPLAHEEVIGGFLNAPENALDAGYVVRNENGHLQLADYGLLRSGVLAYQLGEDIVMPSGITTAELQVMLDEYVNSRVAFPNANQLAASTTPNIINITLDLPKEEVDTDVYVRNIDSRFGAAIHLHISGTADSHTTVHVMDCQKVKIDSVVAGNPKINLCRSCLWYDADVLDRLDDIGDLSIWYQRFKETDPNLTVDGMTVRSVDAPTVPEDLDFWSEDTPNDNHYMFALQSITLGSNGNIVGAGLFVKNESSMNVSLTKEVTVSSFTLPQGASLMYPVTRLKQQIKISGNFVTAYYSVADHGYITIDTGFTALTNMYDGYSGSGSSITGTISFLSDATFVRVVNGIEPGTTIDGWESNSFHIFHGGVIA